MKVAQSVLDLAALVADALGYPPSHQPTLDQSLVHAAIHRHQIGPLLFAAVPRLQDRMPPALREELGRHYSDNAHRQQDAMTRLVGIGTAFSAHRISWMTLKSAPQAAALYGDPALRHSSDIDLLVAPRDFARAIEVLAMVGYIPSNPPAPAGPMRRAILAAVRDVSLIAREDHRCAVDLHRRLFLAVGRRARAIELKRDGGLVPSPRLDAGLACYLILHGAQSYWVRLKWLVDLVPLLARLDDAEKEKIPRLARLSGTEKSVAASLMLLQSLFPFAALGPLQSWLAQQVGQRSVQARLTRYACALGMENDWGHSPLDNAGLTMQAYMSLFESPWTRVQMVPVAALSSLVRRTAGAIWRKERALTRSDAPAE
jgi:Uncharacterised nucleotidyltransferase